MKLDETAKHTGLDCAAASGLLVAWLDGELSTPDDGAIENHLAHCDACARIKDDFTSIRQSAAAPEIGRIDLWETLGPQVAPSIDTQLLDELRQMRQEMQALRAEVAGLRRQLTTRPHAPPPSSRLSLPYMPTNDRPNQLV